jgi:hypothetical protein
MKSYKDSVKSYKDFPKEVIMNAPEGTMWVYDYSSSSPAYIYLKYGQKGGLYLIYDDFRTDWVSCGHSDLASLQTKTNPKRIPLPNVTIPWEATEDSERPVPGDTLVAVEVICPEGDRSENVTIQAGQLNWENYPKQRDFWKIISYKIVDPEYSKDHVPTTTEDNKTFVDDVVSLASYVGQCDMQKEENIHSVVSEIHSDVTKLHSDVSEIHSKEYTLQQQLTQNLKFLQNLGKEFPEIQEDTLAMMKNEFYCYLEDLRNG